jgi:leucyl aminopeptidase
VGELFWPMPMHEHFAPLLKSTVADYKNVGPRWGGAVTAAKFLQKFVGETPWVHLDIAGPSWADSGTAWQDAGATGVPVRSLIQFLNQ